MIITISGTAGSGKSTVAKALAKELGLKHYSTGDFMREMARKRGMTIIELNKLGEKDQSIDKELDERQIKLGRNEKNFVIDGRLSFYFIPNSIKIFLDADIEQRAKRIFNDKRKTENNLTLKETLENIKERQESEIERYEKYYGLNPYKNKHYDILIDTTKLDIEGAIKKAVKEVSKLKKEKNI